MEALASGAGVQQLERLVRVAIFQSANELVGFMLQEAADRIDATYQPKPGQHRKGRVRLDAQGMFGRSRMEFNRSSHRPVTRARD